MAGGQPKPCAYTAPGSYLPHGWKACEAGWRREGGLQGRPTPSPHAHTGDITKPRAETGRTSPQASSHSERPEGGLCEAPRSVWRKQAPDLLG